ncbi:MAG: enoyl-CoA hydratase/isomerase family protein [Myxococcales bacterium]|nr:enoyl-CoA hydratase/isomerase family protein [Myxococcales bacterium]MCB9520136.1 enoyl-CoA hydratase/isomerase family protein [Myxococcales bacterium]MCB9531243.1 enoyl-CoA hydratase/isomerase family protein [Myxococcales bacterium]MCB9534320.1 enoyl-CoA hydratase/isomerase family protein [Myxococcales bacterium]
MSDYVDLRYEVSENIATITLDREESRNAYTQGMIDSLVRALDAAESDDDVRCVIITGAGSTFSAGGDVKLMRERGGMFEGDVVHLRNQYLRGIQRIPRRLARFEKPVIAAINGPAVGAGLDLACMCDIRIAVNGARFGSTFVKIGLIPGDGGAYLLARVVGFARALDMIITGRLIDTLEAERIGLVGEVVLEGDVLTHARKRARKIAENAPLAVRLAKSAVYQSYDLGLDAALNLAATYQSIVQNTPDHEEGLAAFLEGRKPDFRG